MVYNCSILYKRLGEETKQGEMINLVLTVNLRHHGTHRQASRHTFRPTEGALARGRDFRITTTHKVTDKNGSGTQAQNPHWSGRVGTHL